MARLNKKEKLAVKAMMFAFERYGADRLIGATYYHGVNDMKTAERIDFGEAYNMCSDMVSEHKEVKDDE